MNEKISFQQLSELLSDITGTSKNTSELFIKELFGVISDALAAGDTITIKNIGTFAPSGLPNDPILFAPSDDLAETINMPFACFEAVELNDDITDEELEECDDSEKGQTDEIEKDDLDKDNGTIIVDQEDPNETIDIILNASASLENESPNEVCDVELEYLVEENSEDIVESHKDIYESDNSGKKKSLLWLWFLIVLTIGLVVGYLVGNIYPYHAESPIIIKKTIATVPDKDSVIIDSIKESSDTIINYENVNIIDTIGRTRFLTTMARQYYGEMAFWVYIYEENKEKLGNPNQIKPGTTIIIPAAKKYNIDRNDSICIAKAKLKAIEIYAPYQK